MQFLSYTLKWNNECINSWKTQKKVSTQIIVIIVFESFVCIDKMDRRYWHHLVLQVYMDWFLAYFEKTTWNLHITISPWKRNYQSLKCKHNMNISSCLISFLKFRAHFVKIAMSCLNLFSDPTDFPHLPLLTDFFHPLAHVLSSC